MVTMRPPSPRCGIAAFANSTGARTFTSISLWNASRSSSATGPEWPTAALLTRMSSPPSAATVSSTARAIASGSALSARIATARRPVFAMAPATASARSAEAW